MAYDQRVSSSPSKGSYTSVVAIPTEITSAIATIPQPGDSTPSAESNDGSAGSTDSHFAMSDHSHPRLTSTTNGASHVIGSGGTAAISFTRSFPVAPGIVFTEIPPTSGTMPSQPVIFRVESWTISGGNYTGCIVRAWRMQTLPTLTSVSGILTAVITGVNAIVSALSGFNIAGASATGTSFTCIAVQRSDV